MLKKLTDDKIAVLAEQWPIGTDVNKLAEEFSVTPSFLYTFASHIGLKRERRQISHTNNRAKFSDPNFRILSRLDEREKGYLAGIFDGEGCICITQAKHRNIRIAGAFYYSNQLTAAIGNTDLRLLKWLQEKIPEGTSCQRQPTKLSRKIGYEWKLSTIPAAFFCFELMPYLIIKRDEAEIVGGMLRNGFAPLTTEQKDHLKIHLRVFKDRAKFQLSSPP